MTIKIKEELLLIDDHGLQVRHLILKGSNDVIGKQLGVIARERHRIEKAPIGNLLWNRERRRYFEDRYPVFAERMRGFAEAYGIGYNDDAYDLSLFGRSPGQRGGCSAAFYPPAHTVTGEGMIGKNLDFVVWGVDPKIRSPLVEPYILEMHPDQGYASLGIMSFEAFGQRLEGINSEGLAVVHLADNETPAIQPLEPAGDHGIGLAEMQSVEFLLDNCADVEEAKAALLSHKHYYRLMPVHLLVADRYGRSFIWEISPGRNREHIIVGDGEIQTLTNFLIHRHPVDEEIVAPTAEPGCCHNRYKTLNKMNAAIDRHTSETVMAALEAVSIGPASFHQPQPVRTVWRELLNTEERSLTIRFFLGDAGIPNSNRMLFSDEIRIRLGEEQSS